jgi:tetratricopeptide (TPR) repeat protein
MRRFWLWTFCVCLWLAAAGREARAQSAGAESFNFLFLDANARSVGMGGAYTALATDANALLYNPAGLGLVRRNEVTLMHNQYVADMTQDYVGLATRYGVGAQLNYLRWGSIDRTTYQQADGTLGTFGIYDLAASAGYGRCFGDVLSLGVGGKFLRESNDNVSASGWAGDLGAMFVWPDWPWLRLGAALQNLGPDVVFYQNSEKLPLTFRFGAAAVLPDLTLSADLMKDRYDQLRVAAGVEKILFRFMAVRLGFNSNNDADIGITGGAGWTWRDFSVDYAFAPYGAMGVAQRVSVTYRWGERVGDSLEPKALSSQEKRRRFLDQADMVQPRWLEHQASQKSAESPESHFERAWRALELQDLVGARSELEAAAKLLGPDDQRRTTYLERLGDIAYAKGEIGQASTDYGEALKLAGSMGLQDSSVADAYVGMGNCMVRDREFDAALKFYQKAFQINPSYSTRQLIDATQRKLSNP